MIPIAARVQALTKSYPVGPGRVIAVKDVSFELNVAKLTTLFGPSGSGKTPLINCLAGLEPASSGQAWIGSKEVTALEEQELTELRRKNVGVALRFPTLVPTLTVEENLLLPLSIAARKPKPNWFRALIDAAELQDLLPSPAGELPASLQQRVSVTRAILPLPDLVVLDEPTGNLATEPAEALLAFIKRCCTEFKMTFLLATHDPVVAATGHRALLLLDGEIVGDITDPKAAALATHLVARDKER